MKVAELFKGRTHDKKSQIHTDKGKIEQVIEYENSGEMLKQKLNKINTLPHDERLKVLSEIAEQDYKVDIEEYKKAVRSFMIPMVMEREPNVKGYRFDFDITEVRSHEEARALAVILANSVADEMRDKVEYTQGLVYYERDVEIKTTYSIVNDRTILTVYMHEKESNFKKGETE